MKAATTQSIRILMIEDHLVVQAGLRLLIETRSGLIVVGNAANQTDALILAAREQPDIILLDLDLGGKDGLDLLPDLQTSAPQARILVLTGISDSETHRRAVRLGVHGLVHKEQAPEVLLKAIEKVYHGEYWLERSMLASVLSGIISEETKAITAEEARIATLTEREHEVLALVSEGLKNKQISTRLSITQTTVGHHLTSIFAKLGVQTRLELVVFDHRHGLTKRSN